MSHTLTISSMIQNHIARERAKWALSQTDLGQLVETTREAISRIELCRSSPSIERAFVFEALFGVSVSELFPELYRAAYEVLVPRLADWSVALESDRSPDASRKRELLADFASRAPVVEAAA